MKIILIYYICPLDNLGDIRSTVYRELLSVFPSISVVNSLSFMNISLEVDSTLRIKWYFGPQATQAIRAF